MEDLNEWSEKRLAEAILAELRQQNELLQVMADAMKRQFRLAEDGYEAIMTVGKRQEGQ